MAQKCARDCGSTKVLNVIALSPYTLLYRQIVDTWNDSNAVMVELQFLTLSKRIKLCRHLPLLSLKEQIGSVAEWPAMHAIEVRFAGEICPDSLTLKQLGIEDDAIFNVRVTEKLKSPPRVMPAAPPVM